MISSFCNIGGCVDVEFESVTIMSGNGDEIAKRSTVVVRDSKDKENGDMLVFTVAEWEAFVKGVKAGEFDVVL